LGISMDAFLQFAQLSDEAAQEIIRKLVVRLQEQK